MARLSDASDRILDANQRRLDAIAAKESPVAPGLDREGMPPLTGVVRSLAELEKQSRFRFSLLRHRWDDVKEFDQRAAEYDRRREEVTAALTPLRVELTNADQVDADALAQWFESGEKGSRPQSVKPGLERQVGELQREADAFVRAATDVAKRKVDYVQRHRKWLAKEARRDVERAAGHVAALISELEEARDKLAANRESELWALTFPGDAAAAMPPFSSLAGGLKQVGERLGVRESIAVDRVFVALRDDGTLTTPTTGTAIWGLRTAAAIGPQVREDKY